MGEVNPKSWNSLCEVFVPTDRKPDGGGMIATGYPIAKDRIITCGHVLHGLASGCTPEVCWHLLESRGEYHSLAHDYLQFDGRQHGIDAAVLKVTLPENGSIAPLLPGYPTGPAQSMGFPDVGRQTKRGKTKTEAVPIDGALLSYAEAQKTLFVGLTAEHKLPKGWRGASGSPLFVSGRLAGVYVKSPAHFGNARLGFTPLYLLLQIPAFRQAIGFDQRYPGFMPLQDRALELLKRAQEVTTTLVEQLRLTGSTQEISSAVDSVFGTLAALDAEEALRHLLQCLVTLMQGKGSRQLELDALDKLALTLLPLVYRREEVAQLWRAVNDGQPILLAVETGSMTLAEAFMAAADGREMDLKSSPTETRDDVAGGRYFLNPPPDSGIDPGGVRHAADFNVLLSAKLLGVPKQQLSSTDVDKINFELDEVLRWEKCHFYVVYPSHNLEPPDHIARLSQAFPQIAFLGVQSSVSAQDYAICSNLNRLFLRRVRT